MGDLLIPLEVPEAGIPDVQAPLEDPSNLSEESRAALPGVTALPSLDAGLDQVLALVTGYVVARASEATTSEPLE